MKPLLFLSYRSTVNGIRRAVTSPQRLIGLIFVLLYYFQFIFRSVIAPPSDPGKFPNGFTPTSLPNDETISAIVFGIFGVLSLFLMLGSLNPRGGFRPADVDVLFPTPVSPKIVLIFRILRDYLITLLLPLFIALMSGIGAKAGFQLIFRQMPEQSKYIGLVFTLSWVLMSAMFVSIGYGVSLFINRSDEKSDQNKKVISWGFAGVFILLVLFLALSLRSDTSAQGVIQALNSPEVHFLLFGGTFASWMVMGVYHSNFVEGAAGFALMIAAIIAGFAMAMTQIGFLYDQAAAKGFGNVTARNLQRSGDTYGLMAEQARSGRVKQGRIAGRISRFQTKGGGALVWKEMVIQSRAGMTQQYAIALIAIAFVLGPLYAMAQKENLLAETWILLGLQAFGVFIITMTTSTGGFIELLRRVDFQKPLPFSPMATIFWEVCAKIVVTSVICLVTATAAVIIDPKLVWASLASVVAVPSLALVLTTVVLLVTILFPDIEDASQRSFRGLMILLGSVIAASPGMLIFALFFVLLHLNPVIAAIPMVLVNLGVASAGAALAGTLYAKFNPSE
ncbi:hypothetical protein BH11ARM1_BH11ARM1_15510 [soil metagenome]